MPKPKARIVKSKVGKKESVAKSPLVLLIDQISSQVSGAGLEKIFDQAVLILVDVVSAIGAVLYPLVYDEQGEEKGTLVLKRDQIATRIEAAETRLGTKPAHISPKRFARFAAVSPVGTLGEAVDLEKEGEALERMNVAIDLVKRLLAEFDSFLSRLQNGSVGTGLESESARPGLANGSTAAQDLYEEIILRIYGEKGPGDADVFGNARDLIQTALDEGDDRAKFLSIIVDREIDPRNRDDFWKAEKEAVGIAVQWEMDVPSHATRLNFSKLFALAQSIKRGEGKVERRDSHKVLQSLPRDQTEGVDLVAIKAAMEAGERKARGGENG